MGNDFKAFIMRGNVLDLAAGIVIRFAFGVLTLLPLWAPLAVSVADSLSYILYQTNEMMLSLATSMLMFSIELHFLCFAGPRQGF